MNLCVNSRDAMPQGGTLTIATGNVVVQEIGIISHLGVSPGEYVRLSVADTGTGISKEFQEHIFEPLCTTKEVARVRGWDWRWFTELSNRVAARSWWIAGLGKAHVSQSIFPR